MHFKKLTFVISKIGVPCQSKKYHPVTDILKADLNDPVAFVKRSTLSNRIHRQQSKSGTHHRHPLHLDTGLH
jgi:hypothetical protein